MISFFLLFLIFSVFLFPCLFLLLNFLFDLLGSFLHEPIQLSIVWTSFVSCCIITSMLFSKDMISTEWNFTKSAFHRCHRCNFLFTFVALIFLWLISLELLEEFIIIFLVLLLCLLLLYLFALFVFILFLCFFLLLFLFNNFLDFFFFLFGLLLLTLWLWSSNKSL